MFSPIFRGFQSRAMCSYLCAVQAAVSSFTMAARMALLLQPFEPTARIADLEHQAWGKHTPLCPPCPTRDSCGPCLTPPPLMRAGRQVWGSTVVLLMCKLPLRKSLLQSNARGIIYGIDIRQGGGGSPVPADALLLSSLSLVSHGSAKSSAS